MTTKKKSRRDLIKKAVYVAPVILTLSAKPAKARPASNDVVPA